MAAIYLLRHAESSANSGGILAGRIEGVQLSKRGKLQSRAIVKELRKYEIASIYSSPMERCLETIEPYSTSVGRKVRKSEEFMEMDYGLWSGKKLSSLKREKMWKRIQTSPSSVRFPSGESFLEMERRVKKGLTVHAKRHPKSNILIVSHGDPIKMAIALTLGMKMDDFQKIVVDPASLTIIDWTSRTLIGANIPLQSRKPVKKKKLSSRRVLGGGTNG